MRSVGERLRLERETRNTTLEEMVTATGIGQIYLEALERGEIAALPGKAFGKLYIRAYAEAFGFDPQPWIDDYDRERRLDPREDATEPTAPVPASARPVAAAIARWKESRAPAVVETPESAADDVAEETTVEAVAPPEVIEKPRRRLVPILLVGFIVVIAALYLGLRGQRDEPKIVAPAPVVPVVPAPVIPKLTAPAPAPHGGPLTISEFGVGQQVVNGRIQNEGDRFAPGARVSFATRVLGGGRGNVVRHVWLYEGKIEQTITLRVGGPDWRTHSNKTIGKTGAWAVEARDDAGRVLAKKAFSCAR